jgi:Methyltransferase domain
MKQWLQERLGVRWVSRFRRLGRLRWITKYRLLRNSNVPIRPYLAYVLWDPEVESFSYHLADVRPMLATIAEATGVPLAVVEGFAREAQNDPELGDRLAHRLRWRFDVKRRPGLGHRLGWYVLLRALRPALVCETGIYQGVGSLAILRALERNAAEGAPGQLLSFDISPLAGTIVDRSRYPTWHHVIGSTRDTLERAVTGREVGALFHDTPHTAENQELEFGVALRHAAAQLLLVDGSGGQLPVLERLSQQHHATYRRVPLVAADHWAPAPPLAFALFTPGEQPGP